jgi:hypothetical protein
MASAGLFLLLFSSGVVASSSPPGVAMLARTSVQARVNATILNPVTVRSGQIETLADQPIFVLPPQTRNCPEMRDRPCRLIITDLP